MTAVISFSTIVGNFFNNRTMYKATGAQKKYLNYDSRTRQFSCTTAKTSSALTILTDLCVAIQTKNHSEISMVPLVAEMIRYNYISKANKNCPFPWIHKCYKACLNKLGFKTTKQKIKEKVSQIENFVWLVKPPLPPMSEATTSDERDFLATLICSHHI